MYYTAGNYTIFKVGGDDTAKVVVNFKCHNITLSFDAPDYAKFRNAVNAVKIPKGLKESIESLKERLKSDPVRVPLKCGVSGFTFSADGEKVWIDFLDRSVIIGIEQGDFKYLKTVLAKVK